MRGVSTLSLRSPPEASREDLPWTPASLRLQTLPSLLFSANRLRGEDGSGAGGEGGAFSVQH